MQSWQIREDFAFNLNLAETLLFNMYLTTIIIIVPLYIVELFIKQIKLARKKRSYTA